MGVDKEKKTDCNNDKKDINNIDLDVLIDEIEKIKKLKVALNEEKTQNSTEDVNKILTETGVLLANINLIKDEICKIPLNPCSKEFYNNDVVPMLTLLDSLSRISVNLSTSTSLLSNSNIVFRKKSNIKDTIDLVYSINKKCSEVYDKVKITIDEFLNC